MSSKQLEYRYQEADNCYKSGFYDACCVMCRTALEEFLKVIGRRFYGETFDSVGKSLSELVNGIGLRVLKSKEQEAMMIIYRNGNQGAHSGKILDRQEANRSVQSLKTLIRKSQQITENRNQIIR